MILVCDLCGCEYSSSNDYPDESYCPDCINEVFSSTNTDLDDDDIQDSFNDFGDFDD